MGSGRPPWAAGEYNYNSNHCIVHQCIPSRTIQSNYFSTVKEDTCHDPGVPENGWRDGDLPFEEDVTFYFGCNEGYQLQGSSSLTCNNGRWSNGGWSYVYSAPKCKGKAFS